MKRAVAVAAVLLLLIACEGSDNKQPDITIADMVGMNNNKGVSMIDHLDLVIEVETTEGPAGAQGGTILRMEPEPGTIVEADSRLTVFVAAERKLRTR